MKKIHYSYFLFYLPLIFLISCRPPSQTVKYMYFGDYQPIVAPFDFKQINPIPIPQKDYVITSFGAIANSAHDNAAAINKAITECNKQGGGRVVVPAGKWFTSAIKLKSNVCFYLEEGAELFFSDNPNDYLPVVFTRWEGLECYNYSPLIYANNCENIVIAGKGKINGNGEKWWSWRKQQKEKLQKLYEMSIQNVAVEKRILAQKDSFSYLRPSLIEFINSKNILVKDVTITSGPMWTVHFVYCQNVIAQNLQVITTGPNNDGIVPESSENVLIENCYFSTGDDCIVIKSGLNEEGWRIGKPSQSIVIRKCRTGKGHGGVVIGSEMSGGVKNVFADSCYFSHTLRGIRLKSMRGRGGYISNIYFSNIMMDTIWSEAILIDGNYSMSSIPPKSDSLPYFSDIIIKNVTCKYAKMPLKIDGVDKNVKNVQLINVSVFGEKPSFVKEVNNLLLDNVVIQAPDSVKALTILDSENVVTK